MSVKTQKRTRSKSKQIPAQIQTKTKKQKTQDSCSTHDDSDDSFYSFLGIESNASMSQIKKAYYRLALEFHPDKNKSEQAEHKFKELTRIYRVLSDPSKRKHYDLYGDIEQEEIDWEDAAAVFAVIQSWIADQKTVQQRQFLSFFEQQNKLREQGTVSEEEKTELEELFKTHNQNINQVLKYCSKSLPGYEVSCDVLCCEFLSFICDLTLC